MLFDSHAHLDDELFDADRLAMIEGLPGRGVSHVVNVGCSLKTSKSAIQMSENYPFIHAAVGVHPHDAEGMKDQDLDALLQLARHPNVVAIGEIGLDYYYENSPREIQKKRFADQLELAVQTQLPVIVHSRDAQSDTMEMLEAYRSRLKGCVLHCYSGSWEMAKVYVNMGFMISLAGPVTFNNAVRPVEIAKKIDLNHLMIETDCPYLAPHPYRGKRNDPGLVRFVAERIAQLRGMGTEEIARITHDNACNFFGISQREGEYN